MRFKENIFRRDNFKCLMCGNTYDSHFLILYFDTPEKEPTNNTDNIITLCQRCKRLIDEGSKWNEDGEQVSYRWNKEDIVSFSAKQKVLKERGQDPEDENVSQEKPFIIKLTKSQEERIK